MKAVLVYGVASAAVLAALAGLGVVVIESADAGAVGLAAAIAWPVQLAAFAALVVGREGMGFMVSWAGGMGLRFVVLIGVALWVTRADGPDPASLLVSLVVFVMVLVLLEPLFLRLTN